MTTLSEGDVVTIKGFSIASTQVFEGDNALIRNSQEDVGVTAVYISPPQYRKVLYLRNTSAALQTITIFLGKGAAEINKGIVLKAGEYYIEATDNGFEAWSGTIQAISDVAGGKLTISER